MNSADILKQLTGIVRDIFDDDSIVLKPETVATDIPGWDSFNTINIIVSTENHFGIKFQTAETESLQNVGHFAELIAKKIEEKKNKASGGGD